MMQDTGMTTMHGSIVGLDWSSRSLVSRTFQIAVAVGATVWRPWAVAGGVVAATTSTAPHRLPFLTNDHVIYFLPYCQKCC